MSTLQLRERLLGSDCSEVTTKTTENCSEQPIVQQRMSKQRGRIVTDRDFCFEYAARIVVHWHGHAHVCTVMRYRRAERRYGPAGDSSDVGLVHWCDTAE